MDNLIGQSLGRYHILEQLGEGGMAIVYKAYDTRLERDVAVKVIRTDQFAPAVLERILKRFEREAKVLARLTHPNIVHINDYGEQGDVPYLVMDYLSGGTLKQRLGRSMPWQEAARLLLPVARALDYAHRQGMIHRDVKPSNILITSEGEPMLTDFGIAKLLESEETQTLTGTGAGVGTPEYMAPEQWTGKAGTQADIYSLGVVFYEMVTGRKPYTADTPAAILLKQVNDPLPRPSQYVHDLPEEVEKVLLKALAKTPEDRYQSMGEMVATLDRLASGQVAPIPKSRLPAKLKLPNVKSTEGTQEALSPTIATPPTPIAEGTLGPKVAWRRWLWIAGALSVFVIAILLVLIHYTNRPASPLPTATAAPIAITAPTATVPPWTGGWLDQVVFSVVDASSAITQLQAGAIDIYAGGLAAADYPNITKAGLSYVEPYGAQYSILYNPAVFMDKTVLNPFSDKKIREATNYLYDRNYINQEVFAGADLPKWFAITTQFPAYARVADVAAQLEAQYAYNPDKAKQIISTEMTGLGATQDSSGKWQYKGKPVTLNFLIRPTGEPRKPIGDYVAAQLESVGFTVNREYKKASEASPIWQGDPTQGQWNLYTAGYVSLSIDREERVNFQEYYTPDSSQGIQPFQSNTGIDPAFARLCDDLANANYSSLTQRDQMMEQALPLSMQDSLMVFLIDSRNFIPMTKNVQVSYDLAAGVEGAYVAPYTLRFAGQTGGTLKWGDSNLFAEPWNPIAGSNFAVDQATHNFTDMGAGGLMPDPYTGLAWPMVFDKATVTATQGLPIGKTLPWVTLNFVPTITVPSDAFVDWDAKAQKFITAGEKSTTPITAKIMSTVTYPDDLFNKVTWHDGTHLSVADFLMGMIMTFDRADKDSAIYDPADVPIFQSFQQSFVAFRITSTNPLTVEYYTNVYAADAELDVTSLWPGFPTYQYGEGSWHVLAISNLAEAAGQLAYSNDKATANKTEWTSYVGGASLAILSKYLDQAISQQYVPYAPTLGQYITADQAVAAYTNLKNWYTTHGNFWLGTGPYYLDKASPVEKTATTTRYAAFAYPADAWDQFTQPKIADVTINGPAQVTTGQEGDFNVSVSFNNAPYPSAEITSVEYLLFDATGAIASKGDTTLVSEGIYKVALTSAITTPLIAGSDKLVVIVVATPVAIPTFATQQFETVAP